MPRISGEPFPHNNQPLKRFPKADPEATFEFYRLATPKLERLLYLSAEELKQSVGLALQAQQTGVALHALVQSSLHCRPRVHICGCGPKRRGTRRKLGKKQFAKKH